MPLTPPSHRPNSQHCLPSLHSCSTLKLTLQCHPHLHSHPCLIFSAAYNPYAPTAPSICASNATLNPPYASLHLPNPLCRLQCLHSCFRFIGYSGLLAYMMNAITEIC
ncbi:hypothetical protein O181_126306 [Austropuccinia psidii MF-1]|uniref:Uncharacterized protein n=1 Tax=Austropuccinia psidii MF-1 TaxID=1389203 RepID=A0A9Q3KU18_9BASI|nr:hypothetical protein [Austropuccinia psidii MF-1]